jgi:hypothetical protein
MANKKARQCQTRRDRRKAKSSEYRREGTRNPRKHGHHAYDARSGEEQEPVLHTKKTLRGGLETTPEKPRKGGNPYVSFLQSLQRYGESY